jgi:hypothetical protein
MFDPTTTPVNAQYGAPKGRFDSGPSAQPEEKVSLHAVILDRGGYDRGGAYWGCNSGGKRLYVATDGAGYERYTRAASRAQAAQQLRLTSEQLLRPV